LDAKDPPSDDGTEKSVSDEFILLLRLYEPGLLPHAQALVDAEQVVGGAVVTQLSKWAFDCKPTPENYQQFADESEKLISELDHAYDACNRSKSSGRG